MFLARLILCFLSVSDSVSACCRDAQITLVAAGDSLVGCQPTGGGDGYWYQAFGFATAGIAGDCSIPISKASAIYYYGSQLEARNIAIAGTRLNTNGYPDLVPLALINIDPIIPKVPVAGRKYIFTNGIGSNDGATAGMTVADYAVANAAATVLRKTAGYTLVGMETLLPRVDVLSEANRATYNGLLTSPSWRALNGIDFVVDIASQPIMGNAANVGNTLYYSDGIHGTALGYSLIAPIYLSGITSAIASLP